LIAILAVCSERLQEIRIPVDGMGGAKITLNETSQPIRLLFGIRQSMAKSARKSRNSAVRGEAVMTASAKTSAPMAEAPKVGRVTLQLVKPGASEVLVAGSFNEWKPETTRLVHVGDGRWVGDLAVKAGRHEYLFVVDGQWVPDPNARETVQNPFGGTNSVLVVSE
jgi:1,4-alpha-glucan branching enzyme